MSNSLQREPRHLQFLDVLRGAAVLMVLLYHFLLPSFGIDKLPWRGLFRDFGAAGWDFLLVYPLTYGQAGVAVFFVVSGFCIHLSHSRSSTGGWVDFFARRFFRIIPPYWCALLIFFFLLPLDRSLILSQPGVETLGAHALVIHNMRAWWLFGINPSFWTIAVEVQLYAIYPILCLLIRKVGWRGALVTTAAIEISLRTANSLLNVSCGNTLPIFVAFSPFYFWFSWTLGAALAEGFMKGVLPSLSRIWLWLAIVAAIASPLCIITEPYKFTLAAIATALLILRWLNVSGRTSFGLCRGMFKRWLTSLGLISYSLYLYHQPLLLHAGEVLKSWLPDHGGGLVTFFVLLLLMPLVYFISLLSFRLTEKPSNAIGKRWVAAR